MHALDVLYREFVPMGDETSTQRHSDVRSVLGWIVGINAALIVAGVGAVTSVLWAQSTQLTRIATNQESTTTRITELASQIVSSTSNRYDANTAAQDRTTILGTVDSVRTAWAASMASIQAENLQQARQINDLTIIVTRLQERAGISKP